MENDKLREIAGRILEIEKLFVYGQMERPEFERNRKALLLQAGGELVGGDLLEVELLSGDKFAVRVRGTVETHGDAIVRDITGLAGKYSEDGADREGWYVLPAPSMRSLVIDFSGVSGRVTIGDEEEKNHE